MKFISNKKTGFTLIEMMVAVFVFSVVMTLATGAIFSIINAYKTSQALKSVMDNLNSALDSMSRDIRYGTVYHCGNNNVTSYTSPVSCPDSSPGSPDHTIFAFLDKLQVHTMIYTFQSDQADGSGYIKKCTDNTSNCVRLTAPEVHIKNLNFYVSGAQAGDPGQPQLQISISGYAKAGSNESDFNIETMVDQRNLTLCKNEIPAIYKTGLTCP